MVFISDCKFSGLVNAAKFSQPVILCQVCQDAVDICVSGGHIASDKDLLWCKAVFINVFRVLCMSSKPVRIGPVRYCRCQKTTLVRNSFACNPHDPVTTPVMQTVGKSGIHSVSPYIQYSTTS